MHVIICVYVRTLIFSTANSIHVLNNFKLLGFVECHHSYLVSTLSLLLNEVKTVLNRFSSEESCQPRLLLFYKKLNLSPKV